MSEILVAILAGVPTIIVALLYYKEHKRSKQAETGEVEVRTLKALWSQISQLLERVQLLEVRASALETENRSLKQSINEFRLLICRLWSIIVENELCTDSELAVEVAEALEEPME